jgi:hypothetical protein
MCLDNKKAANLRALAQLYSQHPMETAAGIADSRLEIRLKTQETNMVRKLSVISIGILLISAVTLMYGQDTMGDKMGKKGDAKMSSQSATGCLQKGAEAHGYTLTGEDGKVWELRSTKVKLADHVGHKVTVMGSSSQQSEMAEKKVNDSEMKESGGKDHGDLKVTSLKMVSESCQ